MKDEHDLARKKLRASQRDIVLTALKMMSGKQYLKELGAENKMPDSDDPIYFDEDWIVTYRENRGLKEPRYGYLPFPSKGEAEKFFLQYENGDYAFDRLPGRRLLKIQIEDIQTLLNEKNVSTSTEFKTEIPWDLPKLVLEFDGMNQPDGQSSTAVLLCLGKERIDDLKNRFPDEWPLVAEMEYVMRERSKDSAPYVAAAIRYYTFVERNPRLAGYLLNELEVLCRGTERRTIIALSNDQKAGKIGGEKRRSARIGRIRELLAEMHRLKNNTTKGSAATKVQLLKLAADNVKKENPLLWREGENQLDQYLTDVKDGKLGATDKALYFEIFPSEVVEKQDVYRKQPRQKR
jgi:hypothetical protein